MLRHLFCSDVGATPALTVGILESLHELTDFNNKTDIHFMPMAVVVFLLPMQHSFKNCIIVYSNVKLRYMCSCHHSPNFDVNGVMFI